ncbi:MAG TPA: hypothetical protein VLC28_08135 [Flavitalea sp.]|nr:hypothetical protein [Flavitalea sp.]
MLRHWQVSDFNKYAVLGSILLVIASTIFSCTIPKKYQKDKPFIYKTAVELNSQGLTNLQKQELKERLANQIDDSLKVRTVVALRWAPPFFYNRLLSPPAFDTNYLSKSRLYMDALLQSQGFFNPVITDTFTIDTVKNQQRVAVKFRVESGKLLRYDSIGYDLADTALQRIVTTSNSRTNLRVKDGYSLPNIAAELDRMVTLFRNNGYYKITKDDLYAEHDTVVAALIDPTLDPFEQIRLLDSLQKKKENPTVAVTFKQRDSTPRSHLETYRIGTVTIYPELKILEDSLERFTRSAIIDSFRVRYSTDRFKLPFLARNIYLKPGALYRLTDYYKTINTFTNLGAWQQANIDLIERRDSSRLLDAVIRLYPAQKQSLNIDFETTLNQADVLVGSLFGLGLNFGLTNRNAFRESIQSTSNIRAGVEIGKDFIQTIQTSFSQNFYIPRFILPFNYKKDTSLTNARTIASYNMAYTNRRDFFDARSINFSWGYEWGKRSHTWRYIPFNFEYTNVNGTDSLKDLQQEVPTLAYAFNNGLIMSQILSYNKFWLKPGQRKFFQSRFEESGALFGLWKELEQNRDLRRFAKIDVEYKHFFDRKASTWAFRAFGGYGIAYGKTGDKPEYTLPFYKAYYGGGPYSLRAWRVRYAGLGSNTTLDNLIIDSAKVEPVERYGDIKLEGNIEYRFTAGKVFGIKLQGALFTDFGNVWLRSEQGDPQLAGAGFRFDRLYNDLAIAGGVSGRLDFDFFLIRFDWAYKLKDPLYSTDNYGWFHDMGIGDGQFQLGIGYPF